MNLTIIAALIAAVLGFGTAWRIQASTITEMEAANATRIATESTAAFKRLERDTAQVATAQRSKTVRDAGNRADADRSRSAGLGLRLASADTVLAAKTNPDTCYDSITRYGVVLDEVVAAGAEVSADADRLASEVRLLQAAWPKE